MFENLRYLLLQMRNPDDPMLQHEVDCFARVLDIDADRIRVFDLLGSVMDEAAMADVDLFLLGGSGDYSAAGNGEWLDRALESLRRVHAAKRPTFSSCWGFQAMARAMGGRVVHDRSRAEVGTHRLFTTEAGRDDAVFGPVGETFSGQMGHEDMVAELPPHTTLLASSDIVRNQAYRFDDAPIYCTQFHPELNCADLIMRFETYPHYVEEVAKISVEQLEEELEETPESEELFRRFVRLMFPDR